MSQVKLTSDERIPLIETTTQRDGVDFTMTIPVQKYRVEFLEAAVRSGNHPSPNYRLSLRLQEWMRENFSQALKFSAVRFNGRDHVVNPGEQAGVQERDEDMHIEDEYPTDASLEEEEPVASAAGQKRKATSSP